MSEKRCGHHAPSHRFPVLIGSIVCDGLERVPESVAEVENFAEAGFALVSAHDLGLDLEGASDDVSKSGGIAAKHGIKAILKKCK